MELWREYTGEKSASVREVTKKLLERFPWLSKEKSNSSNFLRGMCESSQGSGDDPDHSTQNNTRQDENQPSKPDNQCQSAENDLFISKEGKLKKPSLNIKPPVFGTLALNEQNSAPKESSDLETVSQIYDLLIEKFEEQSANLKKAGLPGDGARVTLDEWRLRAGTRGILGERFSKSYETLLKNGLVRFENPYVYLTSREGGTQ